MNQSKTENQQSDLHESHHSMAVVKGFWLFPSSCVDCSTLFPSLLSWFYSLCAALPGWQTMISAPVAFWGLQCNPDFTFTASWVGISGPPCGDLPATPALLNFWEGKIPQLYYSCVFRDFKSRTACSVLPRLAACLGWSLPPFWNTFAETLLLFLFNRKIPQVFSFHKVKD